MAAWEWCGAAAAAICPASGGSGARVLGGFDPRISREGAIYRFWELGESKWGAVFAHTIVIERPRAWRGFCWVSGLWWRGVGLQSERGFGLRG